jgi:hypothetical protein
MQMRSSHGVLALAALVAAASPQNAEFTLGKPNASIEEPFSDAVGLVELRDGRVVVSDRIERTYSVADFRSRERRTIGRNGIGPTEYQVPFGPIRWRADTLLGYDPQNRRLLKITDNGTFVGSFSFPAPRVGGINSFSVPRGVDPEGRIYWDSPIIEMQPVVQRLMQARIVRWLPGADSVEEAQRFADHGEFEHRFRFRPMPQTDAWVVAHDGRIGILSAAEYRLRWYRNGALVETGPPVPYTPLRLTNADREAFRARKALEPMSGVSASGPPGAMPLMGIERARQSFPDSLFPEVMPPFEVDGAMLTPGGDIWVKRTGPARETSSRLDILDSSGKLRGVVKLPPRTKLLALGREWLYLINSDDNGLQTLERYAYPAALKR